MSKPVGDLANVMDVSGLKVVVTGGAGGIGAGIAQAFAQRGAEAAVLICSLSATSRASRPSAWRSDP